MQLEVHFLWKLPPFLQEIIKIVFMTIETATTSVFALKRAPIFILGWSPATLPYGNITVYLRQAKGAQSTPTPQVEEMKSTIKKS